MDTRTKIVSRDEIGAVAGVGTTVAFGLFDVLTADHCRVLADAKSEARVLIAVVAKDGAGAQRLLDESSRAQMAAALAVVDRVILCDRAETESLLNAVEPERVIDLEAQVTRDIAADVLARHPE